MILDYRSRVIERMLLAGVKNRVQADGARN